MKDCPTLTFEEFAARYCERQESTPEQLAVTLRTQVQNYAPVGFMLLECADFCSSYRFTLTILPYGPNNTFKEPPTHPVSPRGRANDMSVVAALLPAEAVPS